MQNRITAERPVVDKENSKIQGQGRKRPSLCTHVLVCATVPAHEAPPRQEGKHKRRAVPAERVPETKAREPHEEARQHRGPLPELLLVHVLRVQQRGRVCLSCVHRHQASRTRLGLRRTHPSPHHRPPNPTPSKPHQPPPHTHTPTHTHTQTHSHEPTNPQPHTRTRRAHPHDHKHRRQSREGHSRSGSKDITHLGAYLPHSNKGTPFHIGK